MEAITVYGETMRMNKANVFIVLVAMGIALVGCQKELIRTNVDPSSIQDQSYEVTVYEGPGVRSYAVLFDIPEDGKRVIMRQTSFTERIGLDTPPRYIDQFSSQVKNYRTVRISDSDGKVRGYLLVSNILNYRIQSAGEDIIVSVEDPYQGYLQSGP